MVFAHTIYVPIAGREQQATDVSIRRNHSYDIAESVTERMRSADVHRVKHRFGAPVRELGRILRAHMLGQSATSELRRQRDFGNHCDWRRSLNTPP